MEVSEINKMVAQYLQEAGFGELTRAGCLPSFTSLQPTSIKFHAKFRAFPVPWSACQSWCPGVLPLLVSGTIGLGARLHPGRGKGGPRDFPPPSARAGAS